MITYKTKEEKLEYLKVELDKKEKILAREMLGYRGVIHESAASEIKHTKVMVYTSMVDSLKVEISNLEKEIENGD